ncbi:hypothetical protein [Leptolyngbya sp. 'hensonii']|uniref:hypothetical protein n=1 Tax=Leptolyngbya sp. 'hensonii' TaxID=1922337 RepID=UPI000AB0F730|nr:hypothetical protein [Leptolyngbya sp. 'hensonii']
MPWLSHLSDLNVIETVYSGWLTPVELQKCRRLPWRRSPWLKPLAVSVFSGTAGC